MSLRVFHVFFIAVSITMSAVVGAWGIHDYMHHANPRGLWVAGLFILGGLTLVIYGVRFFSKLKELG